MGQTSGKLMKLQVKGREVRIYICNEVNSDDKLAGDIFRNSDLILPTFNLRMKLHLYM